MFKAEEKNRNHAALQTMIYALIFADGHKDAQICPGLYITGELYKEPFEWRLVNKPAKGQKTFIDDFTNYIPDIHDGLRQLFEEIFDPRHPFTQTENEEKCIYCPYNRICARE